MRAVAIVFTAVAVVSSVWATIAAYRMGAWLSHHGVKVNWFLFRVLIPWYVERYKKLSQELGGTPGPLFPQFLVTINVALVSAAAAAILFALAKR